jgi:hypothetical protein
MGIFHLDDSELCFRFPVPFVFCVRGGTEYLCIATVCELKICLAGALGHDNIAIF